jgi:CelD/BcsL family acetyltransferase involved in cellulose biosynthesis
MNAREGRLVAVEAEPGLRFGALLEEVWSSGDAVLPLDRGWDDYLARLESKHRHELRRKMRRLEREYPDAGVRTATRATLESDLETFVDMHRGAQGRKGHFMRAGIETFFRRVAHAFIESGWLRLDLLEVDGRALASTFSFELDGRFYLYNSAYEPEARRLALTGLHTVIIPFFMLGVLRLSAQAHSPFLYFQF